MRRLLLPVLLAVAIVAVGPAVFAGASSAALPSASGHFGQQPKITFPKSKAPAQLEQKILVKGSGPVAKAGDLLVVNFLGQIWRGKVFDSSFTNDPFVFPLGVSAVIPAWDKELVGDHVGDRVLLVVPPADGYGKSGESGAGITGTDTIVFVIDIDHSYTEKSVRGDPHATKVSSGAHGITVTGNLTSAPTIKLVKSTPKPTKERVIVLDRGHGKLVTPGVVVMQLAAVNWSGELVVSTWSAGTPTGYTVADKSQPTAFDDLVGIPLGSRVLIEIPKSSTGGPYAAVADLAQEPFRGGG